MFTDWLLKQVNTPGPAGRAAKLAWNEINNGMISRADHGLMKWREHLFKRAGARGDELFKDFLLAYMDYKNEGY